MRKFNYVRAQEAVDVRWNLVKTHGFIMIPVDILRAPLVTPQGNGIFHIKETPHYKWIKSLVVGNDDEVARREYCEYIADFFPNSTVESEMENVLQLVDVFTSHADNDTQITIVTHSPKRVGKSGFSVEIFDGLHRAAIATALGHLEIRCRIIAS